jgi:hypothetical protein
VVVVGISRQSVAQQAEPVVERLGAALGRGAQLSALSSQLAVARGAVAVAAGWCVCVCCVLCVCVWLAIALGGPPHWDSAERNFPRGALAAGS